MKELEATINRARCDTVVVGTPVDLGRYMRINKPVARVSYEIHALGRPDIRDIISKFVKSHGIKHG